MDWNRLHGMQYVRLAPGAAERIAPYLSAPSREIDELVLDIDVWPEEIRPAPRKGWNGQLIAGDPVLLDASDAGLFLASDSGHAPILIRWEDVRQLQLLSNKYTSSTG